jgi:antitoxin FitA
MAQLIVRNLEDDVKERLRRRAKERGSSMEEEARDILRSALVPKRSRPSEGLGTQIVKRFAGAGIGLDREIEEWRGFPARPATFDDE